MDLANSDALKLSREVDPQGNRTLGLLTKVDLMDDGTNALDILLGKVYPLKLGFIAMVNRSQQDVNLKRPISYARDMENQFFTTHPIYASFAHQCGVSYLTRTLNSILLQHIRMKLPDLKARLSYLISMKQTELMKYGDPLLFSSESQVWKLL
ncbi:Dynamin- GTPase protein [Coelomomyces lativittatus]|nr:Dynamin- GTPase protein [Coelomomyces lativittatus]